MDVIKEIESRLEKYQNVQFEKHSDRIEVILPNKDGFVVGLYIDDCYDVYFEGWHEEFSDPHKALECFSFGLSSGCRLRVFSCGDKDHKWTLEIKNGSDWKEESSTGLLFYPFWRERKERILQNELID